MHSAQEPLLRNAIEQSSAIHSLIRKSEHTLSNDDFNNFSWFRNETWVGSLFIVGTQCIISIHNHPYVNIDQAHPLRLSWILIPFKLVGSACLSTPETHKSTKVSMRRAWWALTMDVFSRLHDSCNPCEVLEQRDFTAPDICGHLVS